MRRAALLLAAVLAAPAGAQTLRIAMSAEPTSADPQHYGFTPNNTLRGNVYDGLFNLDAKLKPLPGLAVSWSRSDDLTWRFELRHDVRFHNGAPFTSADVVFSYCRTLNNDSEIASSFSRTARRLASVTPDGPHAVVIKTVVPEPLLRTDLAGLAILSRATGPQREISFDVASKCGGGEGWPTLPQFNDGTAAIGTGPFRQRSFEKGGEIVLTRNDTYWGPKPPWAEVRLRAVAQAGPRLAGLLSGDYDLIEAPSTADLPRLREDPDLAHASAPTPRLVFLQLDQRESSPFIRAPDGKNPLRDVRVRRALSLAIDRTAIVDRVMDGVALAASQVLPDFMTGTIPDLPVPAMDAAEARRLLAEAGYPDGFSVTISGPNDRYINDARILQVLAQYWNRIGVKTEVDAMPGAVYFGRRAKREFSIPLGGYASGEEPILFYRPWLLTTDAPRGRGTSNYGAWSNAAFDDVASRAMLTMDTPARAALEQQAARIVADQVPIIPLHFELAVWAFRKGVSYEGRMDQRTLAAEVTPR